ncbi:MAG: hypothetical protein JXR76_20230 [Deltaproteobacteria bacterium]|nr:hypothetical protein [Deltaproteobacteria bacterium]
MTGRTFINLLMLTQLLFLLSPPAVAFDEDAFISGEYDNDTPSAESDQKGGESSKESNADAPEETARTEIASGPAFSGRFENQLTLLAMKDDTDKVQKHVYDYLLIQLDMDAALAKNIELKADGVARIFAGDAQFGMSEIVPPRTTGRALQQNPALAALLMTPYAFENRAWLDNAYVKIPVGNFLLTIGKQPLGQGAGYVWNPTDVFVQKDMLDPTYQQEGIVAARLVVPMGRTSFDFVAASPDNDFDNWVGGGRFQFPLGPVQFSVVAYHTRTQMINVQNALNGTPMTNHMRLMMGGDAVIDFEGVRLWGEAAYNQVKNEKNYTEAEGGLEYYFPFETHLMVEYFYYGRGPLQQNGSYDLNSWINVLEGQLKMLGRHFLFESLEHPVADFWSIGLSSFQALSDGSAMVEADIKWDFTEDAQMWFMVAKGFGGREDFLANSLQSWLRLTMYY